MSEFNAYRESSALSCAAMAELAKNEAVRQNSGMINLQSMIADNCQNGRNSKIRDVAAELKMQTSFGLVRDVCFEKPKEYGLGPWMAIEEGAVQPIFLVNTRAKNSKAKSAM